MLSSRRHTSIAACLVVCLSLAGSACSSAKSSSPPPPAPQPALWGDMKPTASAKELMEHMIDPAADYIFDSVSTVIDPKGNVIEKAPKTDEDWEKLRIGAVTLAEGVYLLKVQRPFTPAGDENHSVG